MKLASGLLEWRRRIPLWHLQMGTAISYQYKVDRKNIVPNFLGLMTLSIFGNDLEPTCHWIEVVFNIIIVLSGLLLFILLIGNIQVFLHAVYNILGIFTSNLYSFQVSRNYWEQLAR